MAGGFKKKTTAFMNGGALKRTSKLSMLRAFMATKKSRPSPAPNGVYDRGVYRAGRAGPEVKNLDTSVGATTVTAAAPYTNALLDAIAEGTSDANRVGMKIQVKSLDITFNVATANAAAGTTQVFVDIWVIHDRQPDQSGAAAAGSIFTASNTNLVRILPQNLDRYTVLRHERIALSPGQGGESAKILDYHIPLDMSVRYADGTGAPVTNDLLVAFLTPSAAATWQPVISYQYRVKFTDE